MPSRMNSTATMAFSRRWMSYSRPYTVPIFSTLKANTHATTTTGNAVATANSGGSSHPAVVEADSGMSMPK